MKFVVFGLSVSSSWGNGHATLWRGLSAALSRRGHRVIFFERDVSYYAATRDLFELPGGELILYGTWKEVMPVARRHLSDCDVAMVTSYCPDAMSASDLVLDSRALVRSFYDLDTPVTLDLLERDVQVSYVGARGLRDFDLVLSYAGGAAVSKLSTMLGARFVAVLFGSADCRAYHPVRGDERYRAELSYLGTHSVDRDESLRRLFVEPAKRFPDRRFVIGGSQYDSGFPWLPNIFFVDHVPCRCHPAFYCSTRLNLNVTRQAMLRNGYCPSGRLFEAAACGRPILTDQWEGLDSFFEVGREILVVGETDDVINALQLPPEKLARIGHAARERTLDQHTADVRARELEEILESFVSHRGRDMAARLGGGALVCGE
jgi:spore maturation protein CgeB